MQVTNGEVLAAAGPASGKQPACASLYERIHLQPVPHDLFSNGVGHTYDGISMNEDPACGPGMDHYAAHLGWTELGWRRGGYDRADRKWVCGGVR